MEKGIFDYIPREGSTDFAYDVFPELVKNGLPLYGYVLESGSYLVDIGIMEKYQKANADVRAGKVKARYEF